MSRSKAKTYTLYVGTEKTINKEIIDKYYELCNINTLEIIDNTTFNGFFNYIINDNTNDIEIRTYNLRISGVYIIKNLKKLGYYESFSNKPKIHSYTTCINEKESYKITIRLKSKTISFKNISTLFNTKIDNYSDTFSIDNDFNNARKLAEAYNTMSKLAGINLSLTATSTSLEYFKNCYRYDNDNTYTPALFTKMYPKLTLEEDKALRPAYKGGYCYVFKTYAENVRVIDVNTYYGSIAYNYELPVGKPIKVEPNIEKYSKFLYVVKIGVDELKLKEGKIPAITIKERGRINYIKYREYVELTITNYEYDLLLEYYDFDNIDYLEMYIFNRGTTEYWKKYYDKWYNAKLEATIENNKGKRSVAKLFCNAPTGGFGKKPTGKLKKGNEYKEYKQETVYLPVILFITSIARVNLIRTAQKFYNLDILVYCDSDSIHFIDNGINLEELGIITSNTKLGAYKDEGICDRAKYICTRTYIHETNGITDYKVSGLVKGEYIKFEDFNIGYQVRNTKINVLNDHVYEFDDIYTIGANL